MDILIISLPYAERLVPENIHALDWATFFFAVGLMVVAIAFAMPSRKHAKYINFFWKSLGTLGCLLTIMSAINVVFVDPHQINTARNVVDYHEMVHIRHQHPHVSLYSHNAHAKKYMELYTNLHVDAGQPSHHMKSLNAKAPQWWQKL